jgi:nucleotide-binding universal stress UspA family protein
MYAAAIADHFGARLTLLAVEDPLLVEAAVSVGLVPSLSEETMQELRRVGADTAVPVLITPIERLRGRSLDEIARHVSRILVPVDLSEASPHQLTVGAGIAQALSVPLLIAHVVEPMVIPVRVRLAMSGANAVRRTNAEDRLADLVRSIPETVKTETLVVSGDPAEEIVKLTEVRHANLIVMGLHSAELFGPRMGSVTYRVLSLTHTLVLALPPGAPQADHLRG